VSLNTIDGSSLHQHVTLHSAYRRTLKAAPDCLKR